MLFCKKRMLLLIANPLYILSSNGSVVTDRLSGQDDNPKKATSNKVMSCATLQAADIEVSAPLVTIP